MMNFFQKKIKCEGFLNLQYYDRATLIELGDFFNFSCKDI